MQRVGRFAPREPEDYFVDVAFWSWPPNFPPEGGPGFVGVRPHMVGRKQKRFIVMHSVPAGLDTEEKVLDWLVPSLAETARLCREYLPTKSKAFPAESLAQEVEGLARHLREGH